VALVCGSTALAQSLLQLEKSVSDSSPAPDSYVEFTITVANSGYNPDVAIEVMDTVMSGLADPVGMAAFASQGFYDPDSGIWRVGRIPIGGDAVLTIPAIPEGADTPTCYENLAEISAPEATEWALADYNSNASVLAGGALYCANLSVQHVQATTKKKSGCGRDVLFDVAVSNDGPAPAYNVRVDLYGNPQGLVLGVGASPALIDKIDANASESAQLKWWIECENPAQTADYSLQLSTNTILSDDGVLAFSGQVEIPKTGGCNYLCEGLVSKDQSNDCFIATAAYGSHLNPQVAILRGFRDKYLLPFPFGRRLVDAYYFVSPPIARFIADHEVLRATVRAFLAPIVVGVMVLNPEPLD